MYGEKRSTPRQRNVLGVGTGTASDRLGQKRRYIAFFQEILYIFRKTRSLNKGGDSLADHVTNYQCPACTGPLHFDPVTGKLVCDYCGSSYSTAEIEALYARKDESAAQAAQAAQDQPQPEGSPWSEAEAAGLKVYNCPSCGAELICDQTTAASSCPYCGNPTIVPGELSGALRPDWVIPFRLTKEQAVTALKAHYRKKPLLPKLFSSQNHLEEIKGVYAPFWLYDGSAGGTAVFHAKKVRHWSEGKYDVTETSHFECVRRGTLCFSRIPVDSSTKMPDEHMDAIEPFDFSDLRPFSTAYLPGYMADKYDVDARNAEERARKRAVESAVSAMEATVDGYDSVSRESTDVAYNRSGLHYALLPVWILSTRWNERNYLFAVNGQTGRLVGDLPISKGRLAAWFFGVWAAAAAVLLFLLGTFVF